MFTAVLQVTSVYEDAMQQKEAVIGKLAFLEEGRRRMMDQISAANEKHQEDASVSVSECVCVHVVCTY